mmetsp:Transcript_29863/g.63418  ORF Transcript_29863/g.63418 Transcript_29863/m.63418 type:complete len:89 (-) Transcript_29863:233-499(-)
MRRKRAASDPPRRTQQKMYIAPIDTAARPDPAHDKGWTSHRDAKGNAYLDHQGGKTREKGSKLQAVGLLARVTRRTGPFPIVGNFFYP